MSALSISIIMVLTAVSAAKPPVAPPPLIRIMPLERAASTAEIVEAVHQCKEALDGGVASQFQHLKKLNWTQGSTKQAPQGEIKTQFYRGNVLNEIAVLPRVSGCVTKAKLANAQQIEAVRAALIAKFGVSAPDDFAEKSPLQTGMTKQFGPIAQKQLLMRRGYTFALDPIHAGSNEYLAITNVPEPVGTNSSTSKGQETR